MKVVKAGVLGFCMGVRRAADLAFAQAARFEASPGRSRVFSLGPLIHNPRLLEELRQRGIETLDEEKLPLDLGGAAVIIRAHGVSPQVEAELRRRGAEIIDATCPKVKASQLRARSLAEAGFTLFLAGEKHHAEIAGILGYAAFPGEQGRAVVVGSPAEAEEAAARLKAAMEADGREDCRTALIGQTTISEDEYQNIGETLKKYFPGLTIIQTICAATRDRQEALRELLGRVDAVIIAGGKESANTRRLFSIAEALGKKAWLVEDAASIPPEAMIEKVIGLSAGASTPGAVIAEIEAALLA